MRLLLLTSAAALAATTSQATSPQDIGIHRWIVLGTSGQLMDVDPSPYLPESRRMRKLRQREEEEKRQKIALERVNAHRLEQARTVDAQRQGSKGVLDDGFFDDDEDEHGGVQVNDTDAAFGSEPLVPDIETLIIASDDAHENAWRGHADEGDEKEDFEDYTVNHPVNTRTLALDGATDVKDEAPPTFMTNLLVALEDDSTFLAVQGSIIFAELSCLFVAFIGYLVHSIPLWTTFSFGQKSCLFVAFAAAFLYQIVAIGWYYSFISSDVTLGISSLITRTISLGMVPITTTSFMARARLAAELAASEDKPPTQVTRAKSSRSRKARSS